MIFLFPGGIRRQIQLGDDVKLRIIDHLPELQLSSLFILYCTILR